VQQGLAKPGGLPDFRTLNPYETDKILAEYLLFHYGSPAEVLPYPDGPHGALEYPARCIRECIDAARLPADARGLDLGCAVGRSSFELARHCREVIGIDFSKTFIAAANELQSEGELPYERVDEGIHTTPLIARVPKDLDRTRVRFETGDAEELRMDLGTFDCVLMANLIDRLRQPKRCLQRLSQLVNRGGQLVITSPYTWMEQFTPREEWLGGTVRSGTHVSTLDGLRAELAPHFELTGTRDLPFLIREHARKFQWSVAQATLWTRK
jgi:putative 4-mercaptohistidine N1-methyltranferase